MREKAPQAFESFSLRPARDINRNLYAHLPGMASNKNIIPEKAMPLPRNAFAARRGSGTGAGPQGAATCF
ncbi:hypothetical protein KL86DPRO_20631 [uncultured delta proteobacterium]|uniref:Uncharacterized protein n=1 Tax=uncultured delta proteobacterium TaxID=34034 RepID=A0A212K3T2_9DELT|nr:hypothetical protein KL86DPRO_20631 [uncultured delta proteobacterium]